MANAETAYTQPKLLEVVGNSAYNEGSLIKIFNQNTGDVLLRDTTGRRFTLNQLKRAVITLDDLPGGWAVGHVIEVTLSGNRFGSATVTLSAGTTKQTTSTIAAGSFTAPAWTL